MSILDEQYDVQLHWWDAEFPGLAQVIPSDQKLTTAGRIRIDVQVFIKGGINYKLSKWILVNGYWNKYKHLIRSGVPFEDWFDRNEFIDYVARRLREELGLHANLTQNIDHFEIITQ